MLCHGISSEIFSFIPLFYHHCYRMTSTKARNKLVSAQNLWLMFLRSSQRQLSSITMDMEKCDCFHDLWLANYNKLITTQVKKAKRFWPQINIFSALYWSLMVINHRVQLLRKRIRHVSEISCIATCNIIKGCLIKEQRHHSSLILMSNFLAKARSSPRLTQSVHLEECFSSALRLPLDINSHVHLRCRGTCRVWGCKMRQKVCWSSRGENGA
jgi:hypothetical protein